MSSVTCNRCARPPRRAVCCQSWGRTVMRAADGPQPASPRSVAPELPGHLDAEAEIGAAVGQAHERVRRDYDGGREAVLHDSRQLHRVVTPGHDRAPPVEHDGPRDDGRELPADADAERRPIAEILVRRRSHERVAHVAQQEELTETLVPLEAEAAVPFARAQSFVRVGRRSLDLDEGREAGKERIRTCVIDEKVAALEVEIAEAGVPAAPLSIRLRGLA